MNKSKAFTLVELLVVIAILALLAGALLVVINPTQMMMKGRDSRRLSDMDALNKAIQLAIAEGEYTLTATTGNSGTGTRVLDGTGWVGYAIPATKVGLSKYISTLPADPTNTGANVYSYGATVDNYELNAVLEHPDNAVKMTTDGGNSATAYEIGTSLSVIN